MDEFDATKIVKKITMQVEESQEEFIFETIYPYCENVLQMKISKEELKQILLNGKRNLNPGYWVSSSNGWMCSNCREDASHEFDFCPHCGADMRVTRESEDDTE